MCIDLCSTYSHTVGSRWLWIPLVCVVPTTSFNWDYKWKKHRMSERAIFLVIQRFFPSQHPTSHAFIRSTHHTTVDVTMPVTTEGSIEPPQGRLQNCYGQRRCQLPYHPSEWYIKAAFFRTMFQTSLVHASLTWAAAGSTFCCEVWWHGSSQMTLGRACYYTLVTPSVASRVSHLHEA